jgi:hypothetical protein
MLEHRRRDTNLSNDRNRSLCTLRFADDNANLQGLCLAFAGCDSCEHSDAAFWYADGATLHKRH